MGQWGGEHWPEAAWWGDRWKRLHSERQGLERAGSRRGGGVRGRAAAKDKKCELHGELPSLAEV